MPKICTVFWTRRFKEHSSFWFSLFSKNILIQDSLCCFTCIISFNSHKDLMGYRYYFHPYCEDEKTSSKSLSNWSKIRHLEYGRDWVGN